MSNKSKLEELKILSNKIIGDIVNISLNKELDVLDWHIGIFSDFNFNINSVSNYSLFLIYKVDNHNDCLVIYRMIKEQLNLLKNLNVHEDEINSNRNQYIILWKSQVLNTE
jgi:hypothetical protein